MNENGIENHKTLQEQLEDLKREQAEAERIYRGRMELGTLNSDPASIQVLAQTILDRKMQIEDLEAKIGSAELNSQDYQEEMQENTQEQQETSLTEYHRNPIINWLQRMVAKIEQRLENMEQRNAMRGSRIPIEPKIHQTKYEEYQEIVDTDFSSKNQEMQPKTAHQLFVEKISGNGAYHTYGKNAQTMEQPRTMINPEKVVSQMQKDENSR